MSSFSDEIYKTIGKNVKKYRLANNLSQEKLSEILNVNSKFIGHVERFERYISLKKLIELSKILNIPMQNFFDWIFCSLIESNTFFNAVVYELS